MRDKILLIILFFVLMAAIPLGFIVNNESRNEKTARKSEEKDTFDPYIAEAAELCDEDFCDEALKAMAIIAKSNRKPGGKSPSNTNNNSNLELYKRIETYCSANDIIISINNKQTEIPVSKCSNGNTVSSTDNKDITAAASPWDCFSPSYSNDAECVGVSADGIEYLCENGMSAEEALRWYIPNIEFIPAD